jgi:hypothetical protein
MRDSAMENVRSHRPRPCMCRSCRPHWVYWRHCREIQLDLEHELFNHSGTVISMRWLGNRRVAITLGSLAVLFHQLAQELAHTEPVTKHFLTKLLIQPNASRQKHCSSTTLYFRMWKKKRPACTNLLLHDETLSCLILHCYAKDVHTAR